jgi:hypothetical protein
VDLYTMNENFIPKDTVDEFQSVIWTERYSSAGEVQLVVPAEPPYPTMLAEGTYLGLVGTDEVMKLKTASTDSGLLTVVGKTMLDFLDERIHWAKTTDATQPIGDYTVDSGKLGEIISDRVDKMVINPVVMGGSPWINLNLQWDLDKIPGLQLGAIDHGGTAQRWTVPVGPLYSVIQQLADKDGLGISLYLEMADAEEGYVLRFVTYRGADRTSTQTVNELIRLTPNMETLSGLKEVHSIDGYKNVVYVNYKNQLSVHYEDPDNIPVGFDRRVMVTDAQGEPVGHTVDYQHIRGGSYYGGVYQYTDVGPEDIAAFREQNARDALANHNYIRALDGQVSQNNVYKFGTDYGMGDILELEGLTGVINKARVTEYIRTQDKTGVREYPTLSVLSPGTTADT